MFLSQWYKKIEELATQLSLKNQSCNFIRIPFEFAKQKKSSYPSWSIWRIYRHDGKTQNTSRKVTWGIKPSKLKATKKEKKINTWSDTICSKDQKLKPCPAFGKRCKNCIELHLFAEPCKRLAKHMDKVDDYSTTKVRKPGHGPKSNRQWFSQRWTDFVLERKWNIYYF